MLLLLLLLGGVAGAGAWNYQRNLKKELSIPRPWRGYSEADVQAMADAYRAEIEQYERAWKQASGAKAEQRGGDLISDRVSDFDAVQRTSSHARAMRREMADREVVLEQLERELQFKAGERDLTALHIRRLTTFD
jgi:predicted transcriptional regulator